MDTNELIGAELDAAVARAQGWKIVNFSEGRDGVYSVPDDPHSFVGYLQLECPPPWFRPSTDWSQGGPLLEQKRISVIANHSHPADGPSVFLGWLAETPGGLVASGPTALIAGMRALIGMES